MVVYPDQDMQAARILMSLFVGNPSSSDCRRVWGDSKVYVAQKLEEGRCALIIYDGHGTREAVEPNRSSWMMVMKCESASRGCALHRFDGPSPERARALIEKGLIDSPDVAEGVVDPEKSMKTRTDTL